MDHRQDWRADSRHLGDSIKYSSPSLTSCGAGVSLSHPFFFAHSYPIYSHSTEKWSYSTFPRWRTPIVYLHPAYCRISSSRVLFTLMTSMISITCPGLDLSCISVFSRLRPRFDSPYLSFPLSVVLLSISPLDPILLLLLYVSLPPSHLLVSYPLILSSLPFHLTRHPSSSSGVTGSSPWLSHRPPVLLTASFTSLFPFLCFVYEWWPSEICRRDFLPES